MNTGTNLNEGKVRFRLRIPHTYTLLFSIVIVMAVLTWIIPSGQFDYIKDAKKPTPIAGTYKHIEKVQVIDGKTTDVRQGIKGILMAPIKGAENAADVVCFVLLIGGAFGILSKTGAIEAGLARAIKMLKGRELLVIPVSMLLFGLGGTIFGMCEETLPFYMVFIPLMMSMGYDSLTGFMIIFLGAATGCAASTTNPFSVGIAQANAGLPMSSGINYRWVQWVILMAVVICFVMWYARRVKKNPQKSPMYELDIKNKEMFLGKQSNITEFKWYHGIILLGLFLGMGIMVYGVKNLGWYIEEISMVFMGIGLFAGIVGVFAAKIPEQEIAGAFVQGCRDLCYAAVVIGLARAILIIAREGQIIDTILNALANALNGLPKGIFTTLNLLVQTFITFLVPSSSGHAALTMPIMAPLGDLVHVDRQIIVTAYQYGTGIGNMITPTQGVTMAALGIAQIPFHKWLKFAAPLILALWIIAALFLLVGLRIY